MILKPTPAQIARMLNCTQAQAQVGLRRSAVAIRALTAADLRRWRKTRQEADSIAAEFEMRADSTH